MIEAKRKEIRRLWLQGMPAAQIAAEVGCAKQSVYHIVRHKHTRVELTCIYPALEAWRQRKGLSLSAMCSLARLDPSIAKKMSGKDRPERLTIQQIHSFLHLTGMTFEEAFGGVEFD